MPKLNTVYDHVQVKTTAGRIRHATIMTRTNANTVTVKIGKGTPFTATMQTRSGRSSKILTQ